MRPGEDSDRRDAGYAITSSAGIGAPLAMARIDSE